MYHTQHNVLHSAQSSVHRSAVHIVWCTVHMCGVHGAKHVLSSRGAFGYVAPDAEHPLSSPSYVDEGPIHTGTLQGQQLSGAVGAIVANFDMCVTQIRVNAYKIWTSIPAILYADAKQDASHIIFVLGQLMAQGPVRDGPVPNGSSQPLCCTVDVNTSGSIGKSSMLKV